MKKTLIAVAAFWAVAASAQSGVRIYGVVDASVQQFNNGGTGNSTRLGSGGRGSSRLNIAGREDLGGGMSAFFDFEAAIAVDNGTGTASSANNQVASGPAATPGTQGLVWNRRSYVGLAHTNWGQLLFGREVALHAVNTVRYDPFVNAGVGVVQHFVTAITGPTAYRTSNTVHYALPDKFGGFFGDAAVWFGENSSNAVSDGRSTKHDGDGAAVRFGYRGGGLDAAVSYGKTQFAAGDAVQSNIGGAYEVGFARLFAQLERDKRGTTDARGWMLGATVPVFGSGEIRAATSEYRTQPAGLAERKSSKFALGYTHSLSKRTSVYLTAAKVRNSGGAASSVLFGGPLPGVNQSSRGTEAGLRHSF